MTPQEILKPNEEVEGEDDTATAGEMPLPQGEEEDLEESDSDGGQIMEKKPKQQVPPAQSMNLMEMHAAGA